MGLCIWWRLGWSLANHHGDSKQKWRLLFRKAPDSIFFQTLPLKWANERNSPPIAGNLFLILCSKRKRRHGYQTTIDVTAVSCDFFQTFQDSCQQKGTISEQNITDFEPKRMQIYISHLPSLAAKKCKCKILMVHIVCI